MIRCLTGRPRGLWEAVLDEIRAALRAGEGTVVCLVPAQYTLQAEMDILGHADLEGSFRLQVLSPGRLHARVFQQAGQPDATRIDEQGRALLMHAAAEETAAQLNWYRHARTRRGFAERAVAQVAEFKQAGLGPADVEELARATPEGALKGKLRDIALLYAAYERQLAGRFMDAEDEAREANRRLADAPLLRGCTAFAYGFDILSRPLAETAVALARVAGSVTVALAMENNANARDYPLYEPVRASMERLRHLAREAGLVWARVQAEESARYGQAAIRHLQAELFAIPAQPYAGASAAVALAANKNPRDEAMRAAALARALVMKRGWRYADIAVACQDLETYAGPLARAFALYDVPLFLDSSRAADAHPLAQCLLAALKLLTHGWQCADVIDWLRAGYAPLEEDEADRLVNYAVAVDLRGRHWRMPLTRGDPLLCEELEPVRARLVAPLLALDERLRAAGRVAEKLEALYQFLEDLEAREKLEAQQAALTEQGLRAWAVEGAQVWNRLMAAFDQMHALLGERRLPTREIWELLRQALSAAEVKALPQSGDAVAGGSLDHMKGRRAKALLLLGMSDRGGAEESGLLGDEERQSLSRRAERWLGLNRDERADMRRLRLKELLALTEEFLYASYPLSDAEGGACKPGTAFRLLRRLLPESPLRGGLTGGREAALMNAPGAARELLPRLLREGDAAAFAAVSALKRDPEGRRALAKIRAGLLYRPQSEPLPRAVVERAYGPLMRVSVTRLEQYAACPFRHFARYALRPEECREFSVAPRDVGVFYHSAVERFMRGGEELRSMGEAEAARRMDGVTEALLLERPVAAHADSAVLKKTNETIRAVARRAATALVRQLSDSAFAPCAVEIAFGGGAARIRIDERTEFEGVIDRLDEWSAEGETYLRVIDYKLGATTVDLAQVYQGLQLQLVIYLLAAMRARGGRPAGVFTFRVQDPLIDSDSLDEADVARERDKELRMQGWSLMDAKVAEAMAGGAEERERLYNKDGSLKKTGRQLTEEQFEALMARAMENARRILNGIESGDTRIAPVQTGKRLACDACDYQTICQRDVRLPGFPPRRLEKLSAREVLARLRETDE